MSLSEGLYFQAGMSLKPQFEVNWQVGKRMLILGGGILGLEMGTVYSSLGARLDVVEMLDGLMQGADRDLLKIWQKMNEPRFDNIMLKTKRWAHAPCPKVLR